MSVIYWVEFQMISFFRLNDGLSKAQILDYFENLSSLVLHDELAHNADWKTYGRIIQALDLSDFNTEKVMDEVN